jgi:hypothetical protein
VLLSLSYLNFRSLGDGWQQEQKLDSIYGVHKEKPNVILLLETKCQQKIVLADKQAFQTELIKRGGVVAMLPSVNTKKI